MTIKNYKNVFFSIFGMLIYDLGWFIASVVLLALSAALCVRSLSIISRFLRFSEFIVGFVIMGVATSLPELFVGINSALEGIPSLSLGNAVGSVIVNITLIAGIVTLFARRIDTRKKVIRKDALKLVLFALVPVLLMFIGNGIGRIDGAILLGLFSYHAYTIYKTRREYSAGVENHISRGTGIGNAFLLVISLVLLFYSASKTVEYGGLLSGELGLPEIFIGLFFIALGTSLPELMFGIIAAKSGHSIMSLGDLLGASIINMTLVIGITALITPITAVRMLFLTSAVFMILATFIFSTFLESGGSIDWKEGIALILLYVFFLIVELSISGYLGFA